ncbi:MAG: pilus assembly protein [Maricaulaceae bacterium]|nr:pilus assembly protein [Maricaulaceae bacterium]
MIRAIANTARRALSGLRRFGGDRRGVSAVEFALIAPVMILFYLAMVEISLALAADRKVTAAASAMADLVAQDDEVNFAELQDIVAAGSAILAPFDASQMSARISSVVMRLDGQVEVDWSDGFGMQPLAVGAAVPVPDGLLSPSRSVIMVEVAYDYDTPVAMVSGGVYQLREVFYLRPRRTLAVSRL